MSREEWIKEQRAEVLTTAQQMCTGTIGVIEGSRRLASLGHEFESSAVLYDLFIPFVAIDSQTDHLPIGEVTKVWAPDALAEKRVEIAEAEALHRQDALDGCAALLRGFEQDV